MGGQERETFMMRNMRGMRAIRHRGPRSPAFPEAIPILFIRASSHCQERERERERDRERETERDRDRERRERGQPMGEGPPLPPECTRSSLA
jgi:hypothetical protein